MCKCVFGRQNWPDCSCSSRPTEHLDLCVCLQLELSACEKGLKARAPTSIPFVEFMVQGWLSLAPLLKRDWYCPYVDVPTGVMNRYVLGRFRTYIKLYGKCDIALRGHNESPGSLNPAIFRCIFETMCEVDSRIRNHYDAQQYFKGIGYDGGSEVLGMYCGKGQPPVKCHTGISLAPDPN